MKAAVFCVLPSPYQRDLLHAVQNAGRGEVEVFYLEEEAPDSPWGTVDLEPWEQILPGFCLGRGRIRCHVNRNLPDLARFDATVLNLPLTALTFQQLARRAPSKSWHFWGELMRPHSAGVKGLAQKLLAAPLENSAGIIAIGRRAQTSYQDRFPSLSVHNLPYCCDVADFHPESRSAKRDDQEIRFLFCGQMIERKGIDVLLESFASLVKEHPAARLQLVGREDQIHSRLAALDSEVACKIELFGFQQPSELPELFQQADVFVLPSRHDGWGVVINQAIGAHLSIIASTAVGAAADLVTEGENGFLVEPANAQSLNKAMAKLAASPSLRAAFSQASAARAEAITPQSGATVFWDTLESSRV